LRTLAVILFVILSSVTIDVLGQSQGFGGIPKKTYWWFGKKGNTGLHQESKPVSQFPPFCGKKRRNNGMVLPLPFGTGIQLAAFEQPYISSDLRMFSSANNLSARADTVYQNTKSGEVSMTIRPDVWLFPFLNVYGIIGYTEGRTTPNLIVPSIVIENIPNIGEITIDTTFELKDKIYYHGPVYGFGATVTAGYKEFFILLNYEYTVTDASGLQNKLKYNRFNAKFGILLGRNENKAKGAFWVGSMYMGDDHHFEGEVNVKDILPGYEVIFGEKATYSGNVKAPNPWNFIFGGSLMVNDHHFVVLEMGFFQRQQISLSYTFRF